MDATFHFRQKIGCAALLSSSWPLKELHLALENHPWFVLAPQKQAQIVWSDHLIQQAFPTQCILYTQNVGEGKYFLLDGEQKKIPTEQTFGVASSAPRALAALIRPLEPLGIHSFQVTAVYPPPTAIPSMALFYQVLPAQDRMAQSIQQELTQLLEKQISSTITCLYAPITTGPFLTLTLETKQPLEHDQLMSYWSKSSLLPATPSTLSSDSLPTELINKPPFIVYQDAADAPFLRMQRESCLIGQLQIEGNRLRLCIVPPDPVLSLLECTEQLVMSGSIYW